MSHIGDEGHDRKRLCMQEERLPKQPRLSKMAKGKCLGPKQEAFLLVRIIGAVDIDLDFRRVTNERCYGVACWINPGDEYRTRPVVPNAFKCDLDPVWDELVAVPLVETCVENAVLRLEVLRSSRVVVDPGCSNGRKVVGRAELGLDQLLHGDAMEFRLELMKTRGSAWKPEGFICLEMQLVIFDTEQSATTEQPIEEVYESEIYNHSN